MNNIIQVAMNMAIMFIVNLPFDCQGKSQQPLDEIEDRAGTDGDTASSKEGEKEPIIVPERKVELVDDNEVEESSISIRESQKVKICDSIEKEDSKESVLDAPVQKDGEDDQDGDKVTEDQGKETEGTKEQDKAEETQEDIPADKNESEEKEMEEEPEKEQEESLDAEKEKHKKSQAERDAEMEAELRSWTLEEKDRLFHFVTKIFLMNFPLYVAYKHSIHTSLEELSQQEASALNNYCELSVRL